MSPEPVNGSNQLETQSFASTSATRFPSRGTAQDAISLIGNVGTESRVARLSKIVYCSQFRHLFDGVTFHHEFYLQDKHAPEGAQYDMLVGSDT
jgi:hypothetical protein